MFLSSFLKPVACLMLGASTIFGTSAANALTFNWLWTPSLSYPSSPTGPVTGTISGLLDNTPNQTNGIVTVTFSPVIPTGGWDNSNWSWVSASGIGFSVASGSVTAFDGSYVSQAGDQYLNFDDGSHRLPEIRDNSDNIGYVRFNPTFSSTTFTPVPGPLPILGIPSAILFSRNLRKRIKARRESSSTSLS